MADCPAFGRIYLFQRLCVRQHYHLPRRRAEQNRLHGDADTAVSKRRQRCRTRLPLGALRPHFSQPEKALIASEDAKFAEHGGFDWGGIQYAIKRNKQSGEVKAGGSTISQQLAKNLFLNESRSYVRKGEEAAITAMMEAVTDKDRIFELYLNAIEWHYGVFGAEAASQYFYKRPAANLTKQQAAKLAARVPAPLFYADNPKSKRLRNKTNIILRRMGSAELPESDMD